MSNQVTSAWDYYTQVAFAPTRYIQLARRNRRQIVKISYIITTLCEEALIQTVFAFATTGLSSVNFFNTFFLSTEKSTYIKPDTLDLGSFLSHTV